MKIQVEKQEITNPFKKIFVLGLSTGLGLGYMPFAPGTFGSLLGIPFGIALLHMAPWAAALLLAVLVIATAPVVERACRHWGVMDSGRVVWDEVIGQGIAILGLRASLTRSTDSVLWGSVDIPEWQYLVLAFVIFRILDIYKPYPARGFDRKATGLGVILDDVVAGLYTALVMWSLIRISWPI
jgi:phosphatidylglycerophosphatase A